MTSPIAALRKLGRDRRGSIAILAAVTMPVMLMAAGMGIEVTNWTVVSLELQRTADVAAIAGALEYALGTDAQRSAITAASLAEINGVAGAPSRTWTVVNQTLTDNLITVQIGAGVQNNKNIGVKVTVAQVVPLYLTKIMSSSSSVTISASAWSEVQASVQPCIVALNAAGHGVTGQGNPQLTLTGCAVRSNASISTGGSGSMSAPAFYSGGSISGSGITGTLYPNSGTISDPYAQYAPVQNALAQLLPNSGTPFNDSPKSKRTLSPGTYSAWPIQGTVTLLPGIYYVNGNISLGDQAAVSGIGVTIVTSGAFSMNGGAALTISAATTIGSINGAIPGMVFASNSPQSASFNGNSSPLMTGVVYSPNSDVTFGGTAQGGTSGCLEVIASSVTLQGNSSMASNCTDYGTAVFSSNNAPPAKLVQ
jgi:Flp pilus assembly protein TadG